MRIWRMQTFISQWQFTTKLLRLPIQDKVIYPKYFKHWLYYSDIYNWLPTLAYLQKWHFSHFYRNHFWGVLTLQPSSKVAKLQKLPILLVLWLPICQKTKSHVRFICVFIALGIYNFMSCLTTKYHLVIAGIYLRIACKTVVIYFFSFPT